MSMLTPETQSLWDLTVASGRSPKRFVADSVSSFAVADFAVGHNLDVAPDSLRGATVLISCTRQLPAVQTLLQLDGVARRILLCPPDLAPEHGAGVIAEAKVDTIVSDGTGPVGQPISGIPMVVIGGDRHALISRPDRGLQTEWLLFTSGTTGRPKIVVHTLASLAGPLDDGTVVDDDAIWSTFYDIRRYGGLQMLLRALLGGASMVLSHSHESVTDFLMRAQREGVTHISGTPSHWRHALMSPAVRHFSPKYIRLSGEVADQAVLNRLAAAFPRSKISHAFASTEAGVAFDVRDGLAGFPAALIGGSGANVAMRVTDGTLQIRSTRMASQYLGDEHRMADAEGFVDTGDMLERRGDRYHFVGRREGIINVGGQKVHPEEVEAIINQHPAVLMARVRGRKSGITGAIVVADVVLKPGSHPRQAVWDEIRSACLRSLPAHKVPAILTEVDRLDITESGKLARRGA